MRLKNLFESRELVLPDLEITGLSSDSRNVAPGNLFVCLPSFSAESDHRPAYIRQAIEQGAIAIMAEEELEPFADGALFLPCRNTRFELARLASIFYPEQPETIVAVTGTNGKSSVAHFVYEIWRALGRKALSLGTIGLESTIPELETQDATHTTPDTINLHKTFQKAANLGVSHAALEASSHGLDQYRLDGLRLSAAAFTNLSHDHLDYHHTFEDYFAAKARLFQDLLPLSKTAVLWMEDSYSQRLLQVCQERGLDTVTVGEQDADIQILSTMPAPYGISYQIKAFGRNYEGLFPLIGAYQLHNALVAAGLCIATGSAVEDVFSILSELLPVRGRLEQVPNSQIYIDYAHTPDALQASLKALRPHVRGKLWTVFGCGGDRDPKKREVMGQVAQDYADRVVVTDDNPRFESPEFIRSQILKGVPDAEQIGDRAEAIQYAVQNMAQDDVLLIAGKGHETYQIINDQKRDFDDRDAAQQALARKG